ncbi:MAG: CSLREA domain-containing protein [Chloroflexi bacterium]|nr:CSLREA domain-containing protein [Chloroflexota bacterium]
MREHPVALLRYGRVTSRRPVDRARRLGAAHLAPAFRRGLGPALRVLVALILVLSALPLSLLVPPTSSLAPQAAQAAAFTVNSALDAVDATPGDGVCETAPNNGECTLRAAIQEANAFAGDDTITLPAGTYTLSIAAITGTGAATGDLDITGNLTIIGAGPATTIIDGNGAVTGDRVFFITGVGVTAHISDVTIQGGVRPSGSSGGGIRNEAMLTLTNVTVTGNSAGASGDTTGAVGGGMENAAGATLDLVNSTITTNTAYRAGGGLQNSGTVTLTNTTVSGNSVGGFGGGIYNGSTGTLTLNQSSVTGNRAQGSSGNGGGISNSGSLTLNDSTISGNTADLQGGGMSMGGLTTMNRSTVSGNTANGGNGGGISMRASSSLTVITSTFSGNSAWNNGGGVSNFEGTLTVVSSTFHANSAGSSGGSGVGTGGGIFTDTGTTSVRSTIFSNNIFGGNCGGPTAAFSGGHNLSSDPTCGFTAIGDLENTDPLLGSLQDNGGPTFTHALLAGSPAIDAVPTANCTDAVGNPLTVDQRGVTRPQGTACDIGAFEFMSPAWITRAPIPNGIEGAAASIINGKIYVSHGYSGGDQANTRIYTIATDTWSTGASASVIRSELVGVAVNGKHYALGGRGGPLGVWDQVEIYDPDTDTWTQGAPMPTARAGLGAAVIGTTIYVVGGRTGSSPLSGTPSAANEAYDTLNDTWTAKAPMPVPMMDVYSTVAVGGKVYVIGGFDGTQVRNLVQIYDPSTDSWSLGAPMPSPRSNVLAAECGGKIYAIGGLDPSIANLSTNEAYDPVANVWYMADAMPTARSELAVAGISTGSEVYVIGSGPFGLSSPTHERFTCALATLTPAPPAPSAKTMSPVSGDGQTGGTTLPLRDPFVVQVSDANGSVPVTGHPVSWSIVSFPAGATGQALEILDTTTNGDGTAAVRFTLGDKPGSYTVAARSDLNGDGDTLDTGEVVQFTATAVLVLTRLSPETARTNVGAEPMDVAIRVEAGQPIDGVQVRLTYGTAFLRVVDTDDNASNGVQLVPGTAFGQVLQNQVLQDDPLDPGTGVIEFAAGRSASQPAPSGSILLATIKLQGLTEGTHALGFDATRVEVSYQGQVVEATLRDGQVEVSNYRLVFTAQPIRGAAGFGLGVQPVVAIKDIEGNTRTSDNTTVVTLTLFMGFGAEPAGPLPLTCAQTVEGVTRAVVENGVAVFSGCTLDEPGDGYSLGATAEGVSAALTAPFSITLAGDTNGDGRVSIADFSLIVTHFGKTSAHGAWTDPAITAFRADLNGDRRVSIVDFSIVVSRFGGTGPAVAASDGNPFPAP